MNFHESNTIILLRQWTPKHRLQNVGNQVCWGQKLGERVYHDHMGVSNMKEMTSLKMSEGSGNSPISTHAHGMISPYYSDYNPFDILKCLSCSNTCMKVIIHCYISSQWHARTCNVETHHLNIWLSRLWGAKCNQIIDSQRNAHPEISVHHFSKRRLKWV